MHYEEVTNTEEINAGAGGQVKDADEIASFIAEWSGWLASIIDAIVDFFNYLADLMK